MLRIRKYLHCSRLVPGPGLVRVALWGLSPGRCDRAPLPSQAAAAGARGCPSTTFAPGAPRSAWAPRVHPCGSPAPAACPSGGRDAAAPCGAGLCLATRGAGLGTGRELSVPGAAPLPRGLILQPTVPPAPAAAGAPVVGWGSAGGQELGLGRWARGGRHCRGCLPASPAGCVSALIRQTSVFIASPASGEFHN